MDDFILTKKDFTERFNRLEKNSWMYNVKETMSKMELLHHSFSKSSPMSTSGWETLINKITTKDVVDDWKKGCLNNKKLSTYIMFGGGFGFKNYLNNFNIKSRDIMSRLRSGFNNLRMDIPRYNITKNHKEKIHPLRAINNLKF